MWYTLLQTSSSCSQKNARINSSFDASAAHSVYRGLFQRNKIATNKRAFSWGAALRYEDVHRLTESLPFFRISRLCSHFSFCVSPTFTPNFSTCRPTKRPKRKKRKTSRQCLLFLCSNTNDKCFECTQNNSIHLLYVRELNWGKQKWQKEKKNLETSPSFLLYSQAKISWTRSYNDEWFHDECDKKHHQHNTTASDQMYDHVLCDDCKSEFSSAHKPRTKTCHGVPWSEVKCGINSEDVNILGDVHK